MRPGRLELSRLVLAFAISLAIHLLCFGSYELGRKYGVWQNLRLPVWLQKVKTLDVMPKERKNSTPVEREAPLMFVDVNPRLASFEPPKNAKFYSDKNSQAANPNADRDTGVPKITGKQTEIVKAEDVPRTDFKLQPSLVPADRDQTAEEARPKPPPGDLVMAKPQENPLPDTGMAEQPRPRTIREALARQHNTQLPGQKMKQEGGVSWMRIDPGFDVKATPFGAYDAAFIAVVCQHWYDLLDEHNYAMDRTGKVVLQFHLNYDGRITDMKVVDCTVGDVLGLLCQKAVLDPAPFEKWPGEMRLMVDKDYREIQFTFYY